VTVTAVGTGHAATANNFSLTPGTSDGKDHFILLWVTTESTTQWATALSSTNLSWATPLAGHTIFTTGGVAQTVFIGKVTSPGSAANQAITFNSGTPTLRIAWQEFSTTAGYASITLDASGTIDVGSSGKMPPATSTGTARTYGGYVFNNGTGTAGSTSGFTYFIDPNGNQLAYNTSCGSGLQQPNIGDTADGTSGIAVLLFEAVTSFPGAAALSGTGSLTTAGIVRVPGAAVLAGSGTLTATPAVAIPAAAALLGSGTLTASPGVTAIGQGSATLIGTGSLIAGGIIGWMPAAALSGTGVLSALRTGTVEQAAALSGSGTLTVAGSAVLRFTAGLFGGGFLSIPQVAGGLVSGVGGAGTPQALPGSSQVAVAAPGSSNWMWLGTLGQVTALTYSYVCPGGCDKMSMTIMVPASYRTQSFYSGWQVKITRGGHQVWDGKIDQAQFTAGQGWSLTAVGTGNRGTDFVDFFAPGDVWPVSEPDEIINRAIGRGLPWTNPGLNSSPYFSQFWLGQATDPGSQTVTAFLNLICTRGGLTWYVNSQPGGIYNGDDLNVFPLPTVPNRLLVCATPVPRSLGGYTNSLIIRYCSVADNSSASPPVAASFNVVSAINQQSVAAHGTLEQYLDLSDAGQLSSSAAQAVGNSILQSYVAASYAGPFTVSYGQLLNMGGQAVDIACDQAGSVVKLVLTDDAYGGSPEPNIPVSFLVGSYSYNDFTQTAQIAPFQSLDESLSGLLSMTNTVMTPVTVAS
jgi:hypothetical protein